MKLGKFKLGGISIVATLLLSTASFAQDAGTEVGVITQVTIADGDASATDDLPVVDDTAVDPAGDDQGIAVGEPDPNAVDTEADSGTDDPAVDPGVDDGTDPLGDDGVVVIYTMDPGPCIDCNVVTGGEPGRPINPTAVERTQTVLIPKRHSSDIPLAAITPMAECLGLHPRAAWICEWQNGAGQ